MLVAFLSGSRGRGARTRSQGIEGRDQARLKVKGYQLLTIAYSSLAEVETHIRIAGRLNYLNEDQIINLLFKTAEIGKMINGLRKSIEKRLL